ncbi:MAG: TonB-dependent receptor [Acidobacteria bacterium]|nr:TonB-dependent receptor [Acidobacteriota bacterium]
MGTRAFGWMSFVLATAVVWPSVGSAQEATVAGAVTDSTGGVLPGVTVTAVHETTGNVFLAVSDDQGLFRIPVRVGAYRLTAELPGFATVTRTGISVLVGQAVTVNLEMRPSAVQETVTVTAEAPLVDVTQSRASGNIDPLQMQELPILGRDWQTLSLLAPGSRANAVGNAPLDSAVERGAYQLNIDGLQVTNNIANSSFGNPGFSRDAIAEFEFVANRFDATQGRSMGVQLNAVTKSGTNTYAGTFSGYFRHDRFVAADFITGRVLPYSNQQVSATFGGPIRRDRFHFFANYEYEREPQTFAYSTPFPRFNLDLTDVNREHQGGGRLDAQFSPQTRLTLRGSKWRSFMPFERVNTGAGHPSGPNSFSRQADQYQAGLVRVFGSRALNELKVGYAGYKWSTQSIVPWDGHPQRTAGVRFGAPQIQLVGLTIGQVHTNTPQTIGQDNYWFRDDFTLSYNARGRHDLKVGGEYIYNHNWLLSCRLCMGQLDARGGPVPRNIEDLIPVWNDPTTWNLAALSSITRRYILNVGNFRIAPPRGVYAGWVQDDWRITPRLTMNLGLRYDLYRGVWANWDGAPAVPPFVEPPETRPDDTDNFGPRLGFAFGLNDRTVVRGGFGKYFADVTDQIAHQTPIWAQQFSVTVENDGRPDFAANPFNGPAPGYEQAAVLGCAVRRVPGCLRASLSGEVASPFLQVPYSWQTSIGVQRQLGATMALEADYVFTGARNDLFTSHVNLNYDPATGANRPFGNINLRPLPDWGTVTMAFMSEGHNYSNLHALQLLFTKRFSARWQASATYTLSGLWEHDPVPFFAIPQPAGSTPALRFAQPTFPVAPDIGGEYGLAATDQRHRAVFNGIWDVGYGFRLSGLYFFGSGQRFATNYGGDLRQVGTGGSARLRPDGTIVERNSFVGRDLHRVDLRIQRRFPLGGRVAIDGILEVFNLFNHENFGSYVTAESSRAFGRPQANANIAYVPRTLQLGFRAAF